MVTALRTDRGMKNDPVKIDDGPALVEEYRFDADGTAYRVLVVRLGGDDLLVLADPCAAGRTARRYMPLNDNPGELLSQDYVGEKLGFDDDWRGTDCRNLTILIGYALERPVLVKPLDGTNGYIRVEPTEPPADTWS